MAKIKVSSETVEGALKIAKGTAKPGQTKEQTKIIAQGIEKGIAEYKKREKAKARERDKERKKALRQQEQSIEVVAADTQSDHKKPGWLPWTLLLASWISFAVYVYLTGTFLAN
jgi:hypothetical protein